jgi:hypothetical protein
MADGRPDGFDPIDPEEPALLRRFQAWTDQAVAPEDPATVVRVTTTGVRGRFLGGTPGGHWALVASMAVVVALVAGGLALRPGPSQTAQSTENPGVGASIKATELEATDLETDEPEMTPEETDEETTEPSAEPEPTFESLEPERPDPTNRPRRTAEPDRDPTLRPAWTPRPGFRGSLTVADSCHHADGTEEVLVEVSFHSPVDVTMVEAYFDDEYFARGPPGPGSERVGTVTLGRVLEVGITAFPTAKVFTGPSSRDLVAVVEGDPFLVPEGPPCPGG